MQERPNIVFLASTYVLNLKTVQSVALPVVKDRCGVKSIHKFVCHKSSFKPPLLFPPTLYPCRPPCVKFISPNRGILEVRSFGSSHLVVAQLKWPFFRTS